MLFLCSFVWGQNYFKTPGGIPHLPVLSTAPTANLSSGLMYINSTDNNLYWYNGSQWVSIGTIGVTSSVSGTTTNDGYFKSVSGNPVIPVLAAAPTGITLGAVYFNSSSSNFYWYNGSSWEVIGSMVFANNVSFTTTGVCYTYLTYTATYSLVYSDNLSASACAESGTTFQWYRATDAAGTNKAAISGATGSGYTIADDDVGYYIAVGVTPGTACGAATIETYSAWKPAEILYAPDGTLVETITLSNGQVWMDRNIGASETGGRGSYFQWCRGSDGHQIVTYDAISYSYSYSETSSTQIASTETGNSYFITTNPWMTDVPSDGSLWWNGTSAGANNPCPDGFHVPTRSEYVSACDLFSISNDFFDALSFYHTGFRSGTSGLTDASYAWFWTSTYYSTTAAYRFRTYTSSIVFNYSVSSASMSYGLSIRCIKD